MEVYTPSDHKSPALSIDVLSDVYKGVIKHALCSLFEASSEQHVVVHRKPDLKVVAAKAFKAAQLMLAPLTTNVSFASSDIVAGGFILVGKCFDVGGVNTYAFLKPVVAWPSDAKQANKSSGFIVAFWSVQVTHIIEEANAELVTKEAIATSTVGRAKDTKELNITVIVSTKAIAEGGEIIVYKPKLKRDDPPVDCEPKSKKLKGNGKKGNSCGKGSKVSR